MGALELKAFAEKYSWRNQMNGARGLDSWSNYGGEDLGHVVVVPGIGRNRDSDILQESNFSAALDILGGESETVQVHRFGHWGCGWFEIIVINPADSTALSKAIQISESLDSYPVLDDSDYSEREYEYYSEYADGAKGEVALVLCRLFGLPDDLAETTELLDLAYELNMQQQFYAGADSCLFNNEYHVDRIDECDLRSYERCLESCERQDDNPAYHLILACFGMDDAS